jgi:hypothetical protein
MEPKNANQLARRQIGLAAAALALAFAFAMILSPSARAAVSALIEKITVRGMTILVDETQPILSGEGETYSTIWKPSKPDEIAEKYPFFDHRPQWLPEGYQLQEEAGLFYASMYQEEPSSVLFQWNNGNEESIQLEIIKGACPKGPDEDATNHIGPDCSLLSYFAVGLEAEPKIITVNQEPAVLFRGMMQFTELYETTREWNPVRGRWDTDPDAGLSLFWENEERTYALVAWGREFPEEAIIIIAESIR